MTIIYGLVILRFCLVPQIWEDMGMSNTRIKRRKLGGIAKHSTRQFTVRAVGPGDIIPTRYIPYPLPACSYAGMWKNGKQGALLFDFR